MQAYGHPTRRAAQRGITFVETLVALALAGLGLVAVLHGVQRSQAEVAALSRRDAVVREAVAQLARWRAQPPGCRFVPGTATDSGSQTPAATPDVTWTTTTWWQEPGVLALRLTARWGKAGEHSYAIETAKVLRNRKGGPAERRS